MSEVGKKLQEIYEAMRLAYAEAENKEIGAQNALKVYDAFRGEIQEISWILANIQDLYDLLTEALKKLQEERLKEEKRAITLRGRGCIVVKLVPCGKHCSGCPHGPYAYEVHKVGGKQIWKYLGKAW